MKVFKLSFITLLVFLLVSSISFSRDLSGYTKKGTLKGVTLYYKVTDFRVSFAAVNQTDNFVHVKVKNVSGSWTDNKTRTKDVIISYIPPGKTRSKNYNHSDNYSSLKKWSFSGWSWSEKLNDL